MRVDLLERLGEGVEERPSIAWTEFLVLRFPPVGQNFGDLTGGDGAAIRGLDDKVMGTPIVEAQVAVGLDAVVQLNEVGAKLTNSTGCQLPEIPDRKPRVFPADLDESRKRKGINPAYKCSDILYAAAA